MLPHEDLKQYHAMLTNVLWARALAAYFAQEVNKFEGISGSDIASNSKGGTDGIVGSRAAEMCLWEGTSESLRDRAGVCWRGLVSDDTWEEGMPRSRARSFTMAPVTRLFGPASRDSGLHRNLAVSKNQTI